MAQIQAPELFAAAADRVEAEISAFSPMDLKTVLQVRPEAQPLRPRYFGPDRDLDPYEMDRQQHQQQNHKPTRQYTNRQHHQHHRPKHFHIIVIPQ
eukprot:scaffold665776_cov113-Prasinocladus_malaysianus.AAC.1